MRLVMMVVVAAMLAGTFLGWLVPLVVGIVRLRRGRGGAALVVLGVLWGIVCLGMVGIAVAGYRSYQRYSDIKTFEPSKYQGTTGEIVLSYQGDSTLTVLPDDGGNAMELKTTDGRLKAPAGTYRLMYYVAEAKTENDVEWLARCSFSDRQARKVQVAADKPAALSLGPPFTVSVSLSDERDDTVTMDLKMVGRDGADYTLRRKDYSDKPPRFKVLDEQGKVVWQGAFEFG